MPEGSLILDRTYFDKPEWRDQKNARDGFSASAAWLDVLALTNQKAATFEAQGTLVDVARGQCGWSKLALAERWGWSQGKVSARLEVWRTDGRITVDSNTRRTIITVTNYEAYQNGLLGSLVENQLRTKCEPTGTEKGEGRREVLYQGEKGEGERPRLYPLEMALKHFGEDSGYTPDQVREQWLYYDAIRNPETGDWQKPRGATGAQTLITDPRSELAQALLRFAEKKSAANGTVSASVTLIQLETELRELEEQIHQDRQTNCPRDAKKIARVRELREQLGKLNGKNDG